MRIRIMFWIRDGKNVNCQVTVHKTKANFAVGIECFKKDWNYSTKRTKDVVHNATLAEIEAKLIERHQELLILQRNTPHTAKQLVEEVWKGAESPLESFDQLADEWLALRKAMIGSRLQDTTYKGNASKVNNIRDFITYTKNKYRNPALWNNGVAMELEAYVNKYRGKNNHASKVMADCCRIFEYAKEKGYFATQLVTYQISRLPTEKSTFLLLEELKCIEQLDLSNDPEHVQRTRDGFLLQCYTGVAFAELTRLTKENIFLTPKLDWQEWILTTRKKTERRQRKPCIIPLLPQAKSILEKYGYTMPKFYNGGYNTALKGIICRAGIAKDITSHDGRRTFGNILFELGVSSEAISRMYGHQTTKMTETAYITMQQTRIAKEIRAVLGLLD